MFGKLLRIVGLVLLAVTAVITLLSGIGTTCVALNPAKYNMAAIAPYQWLYILYVIAGIIIGVMGILATVTLIRNKPTAFRAGIISLTLGLVIGGLHMATSRALRGSSMPLDFIVYATAFTLLYFLLLCIFGGWSQTGAIDEADDTSGLGVGIAMIVVGIIILTVQIWAGSTHVINGVNYAEVWHTQMMIVGGTLAVVGGSLLLAVVMNIALPHPLRRFSAHLAESSNNQKYRI